MSRPENDLLARRTVARDSVEFRGHAMVRSSHPTTIEITTEDYLTENGDCIIGVGATKGCAGLDRGVKEGLREGGSRVSITFTVGGATFNLKAQGDPRLSLTHPHDMVIRTSEFISDRTLAIRASAAARQIPREMVRLLKDSKSVGRLDIEVEWA